MLKQNGMEKEISEDSKISKIKSLEDLVLENCFILFDTSIISSPLGICVGNINSEISKEKTDLFLGRNSRPFYEIAKEIELKALRKKIEFCEKNKEFLFRIRNYILRGYNFFITTPVLNELCRVDSYCYKKSIKSVPTHKSRELKNLLQKLRREIRDERKERRKLINTFVDSDKLLASESEIKNLYCNFLIKYQGPVFFEGGVERLYSKNFDKYHKCGKRHNLSYTDFDFLVKGLVLAFLRMPVILLSNDYHIFYAMREIFMEEHLNDKNSFCSRNIKFFTRVNFFDFNLLN